MFDIICQRRIIMKDDDDNDEEGVHPKTGTNWIRNAEEGSLTCSTGKPVDDDPQDTRKSQVTKETRQSKVILVNSPKLHLLKILFVYNSKNSSISTVSHFIVWWNFCPTRTSWNKHLHKFFVVKLPTSTKNSLNWTAVINKN
jgi:hypothetical protein